MQLLKIIHIIPSHWDKDKVSDMLKKICSIYANLASYKSDNFYVKITTCCGNLYFTVLTKEHSIRGFLKEACKEIMQYTILEDVTLSERQVKEFVKNHDDAVVLNREIFKEMHTLLGKYNERE